MTNVPYSSSLHPPHSSFAGEIAQTRKKIAEGIEAFDEMYDTLRKSANSTTKDKLEADLKTQIKKLQRMRDDVKKWAGSSDVKDKGPLLEDRKTIEQVSVRDSGNWEDHQGEVAHRMNREITHRNMYGFCRGWT